MKNFLLALYIIIHSLYAYGQKNDSSYDEALAKSLGADEYGMKSYVFVILKTGQNKTTDKNFIDSCFAGHMKNIGRLADSRQLIVAGPFNANNDDFRGLFVLNVSNLEEANKLLQTDPAIKADLLYPVLYPWYGSAALPLYLDSVKKITRSKIIPD